jgi:hypothetical protein
MSREALRPRNLNVNYLPPPLILSSPPSSPKIAKKKSAKHWVTDNHSAEKHPTSRLFPTPTALQQTTFLIAEVSQSTTQTLPVILDLEDNYSSSYEAYIELAESIPTNHSAKQRKKSTKKPTQNLLNLPKLPTFDPLQPIVPPHKA